jgi:hypothetical protein
MGRPIAIAVSFAGGGSLQAWLKINGVRIQADAASPGYLGTVVPNGATYQIENGGATLLYWHELR